MDNIIEMEWMIEAVKKWGLPVVSTMSIGILGDTNGVSVGECGVRMVQAGADVGLFYLFMTRNRKCTSFILSFLVGLNCLFDPFMMLQSFQLMKEGLKKANLDPFMVTQPNGFLTTGLGKCGYNDCPEFPFGK